MFCPNCGASVEGRFCAKCGTSMDAAAAPAGAASPGAQPYAASTATRGAIPSNVAGTLSYLLGFITGILFLVLAPYSQDKFVRFHAFQSIFISVAWFVVNVAQTFLWMVLPWGVAGMLSMLIGLAFFAAVIFLMVKAYQGERFKLPIVGDLAEKQA